MLIAVEGPNGVGKSSLVAEVCAAIEALGQKALRTREPTDSTFGQAVRESEGHLFGRSLALAVAADRLAHCETVIQPSISRDVFVITDRYLASSLALQSLDGVDMSETYEINRHVPAADITIYLEAAPAILNERIAARKKLSRFEETKSRDDEIGAFRLAKAFLDGHGWHQRTIESAALTVSEIAGMVVTEIALI